jgi:hypothetical protein
MTIDKSEKFWKGTDAADLDEFVPAFAAGGYAVERMVHSRRRMRRNDIRPSRG